MTGSRLGPTRGRSSPRRRGGSNSRISASGAAYPSWDAEIAAEAPLRQVWEIEPGDDGTCRLTVVTEGLVAGSKSAEEFEGGIVLIVSGLKTMLETGDAMVVEAG